MHSARDEQNSATSSATNQNSAWPLSLGWERGHGHRLLPAVRDRRQANICLQGDAEGLLRRQQPLTFIMCVARCHSQRMHEPIASMDSMCAHRCSARLARLAPTDHYIARRDWHGVHRSSTAGKMQKQLPSSIRCYGRTASHEYGQGFVHASRRRRGKQTGCCCGCRADEPPRAATMHHKQPICASSHKLPQAATSCHEHPRATIIEQPRCSTSRAMSRATSRQPATSHHQEPRPSATE